MDLQNTILAKLTSSIPSPPMRLRDLIRQIRAARTAADERSVINKECAYIRSTFREEDNVWRCRNVAKLLYIHMLGYPAHFGQMECLKLIASPKFTDKRIGYLGAMLLLDERQDIHLLITNSLKNDLNSQTQFVVGLALCALGSICSPEMSRDLAGEVERLMKSPNTFIRKKAALCAARIIRKVPEFQEVFLPASRSFITEKNHAVLITGITLITEMCERCQDTLAYFKKMVPNLVKILKNLIMSGYSPEHDVCGVSDPFLQVKILRLLRILGHNDEDASEQMNDILAQVATNTESTKNVGNAILYETVISIMEIKSESSLRVLAVNILGRFLLNTDKNIRYVALTTLLKTVQADYNAVQRHRSTIVDCLKDPDVSIRKKAMELCFALINSSNIKSMSKELILFLEKSDYEFKSICSSNLCICAEKYAPNTKWHIDTMIRVLTTAGNYVRDDVVGNSIQLISEASALHAYAVQQLWAQLLINDLENKKPLVQVAMWTLGEFADLLNIPYVDETISTNEVEQPLNVSEDQVIDVCEEVLTSNLMNIVTKEYTIEALMKLSVRFPDHAARIKKLLDLFSCHMNIELQQRAVEFCTLFTKHSNLRPSLLEKMPPLPKLNRKTDKESISVLSNGDLLNEQSEQQFNNNKTSTNKSSSALLDLLGEDTIGDINNDSSSTAAITTNGESVKASSNILDLLGELDLSATTTVTNNNTTTPSNTLIMNDKNTLNNQLNDLFGSNKLKLNNSTTNQINNKSILNDDLFSDIRTLDQSVVTKSVLSTITAVEKNGLKIVFNFEKNQDQTAPITIHLEATNQNSSNISDFLFQAAVPKTFQLTLLPPSGNLIPSNNTGSVKQTLKVNPSNNLLRMKLKISYNLNGNEFLIEDTKSFPVDTWK